MNITEQTTVADIAANLPSSVRVFQRHGIDFCCGGKKALGVVCEEQGLSFPEIATAITASATERGGADPDWTQQPLPALIDHIVATYHDALREELPRLEAMSSKVARVHGARAPFLAQIADIVAELSADMKEHMHKEEMVLFPTIRAITEGQTWNAAWVGAPIAMMEQEHDRAGYLIAELRRLSGDYAVPEWGCGTYRALYAGLEEFERAMHVHVHLENNVLFPRALRAANTTAPTA